VRAQVDLKTFRKDFTRAVERDPKSSGRREDKEKDRKIREKLMCLDFELKKEQLKS